MAFMLNETLWSFINDDPISVGWANFAFIVCSLLLWERIVLSIRIQKLMERVEPDA